MTIKLSWLVYAAVMIWSATIGYMVAITIELNKVEDDLAQIQQTRQDSLQRVLRMNYHLEEMNQQLRRMGGSDDSRGWEVK